MATNKQLVESGIEKIVKKVLKEKWYKGSVPTSADFKKGDKVMTRDGGIETVVKINSNGNIETKEGKYSWPPYTLKLVERGGKKISETLLKEKKTNRLDELNLIRSKYFDAFERDCIVLAKKYWGPDGCTREDFVGSASRFLPNELK